MQPTLQTPRPPIVDVSPEWLAGYKAAMIEVGMLLLAEAEHAERQPQRPALAPQPGQHTNR